MSSTFRQAKKLLSWWFIMVASLCTNNLKRSGLKYWACDERNVRRWLSSERSTLSASVVIPVITRSECLTITYLPVRLQGTRQSLCKLLERRPSVAVWRYSFRISAWYRMLRGFTSFCSNRGRNITGWPEPEPSESTLILFLWTPFLSLHLCQSPTRSLLFTFSNKMLYVLSVSPRAIHVQFIP